jgi:hypothetical protein
MSSPYFSFTATLRSAEKPAREQLQKLLGSAETRIKMHRDTIATVAYSGLDQTAEAAPTLNCLSGPSRAFSEGEH